jgi:hypothetical protein
MALPLEKMQFTTCTACVMDYQHCHGTALVTDESTYVCSDDPDCTLAIDEHWFVSIADC